MKKVEVDRLIGKALVITGVVLCIMFGMWLIQQGYFSYTTVLAMPTVMIVLSSLSAIGAVVLIVLGTAKNTKFYKGASCLAALAILFMLVKINYEIKALQFAIGGVMVKFFPLVLLVLFLVALVYWAITIVKIIRN